MLLSSATGAVQAAGIQVNASCTLIDAITAANTDAIVNGCGPGSGADTITFDPSITTVSLTTVNNTGNGLVDNRQQYRQW